MPYNPERHCRGGDVEGDTRTDVEGAVGKPIEVAKASYQPGYDIGESTGYANEADVKQGFARMAWALARRGRRGSSGGVGEFPPMDC